MSLSQVTHKTFLRASSVLRFWPTEKSINVFLVRLSLYFWQQNVLANPHPGSRQRRLADLSKMRTTTPL